MHTRRHSASIQPLLRVRLLLRLVRSSAWCQHLSQAVDVTAAGWAASIALHHPGLQVLAVEAVAAWGVDGVQAKAGHGRAAADVALCHVAAAGWGRVRARAAGCSMWVGSCLCVLMMRLDQMVLSVGSSLKRS